MAVAWGSSSSLAGLQRSPSSGAQGHGPAAHSAGQARRPERSHARYGPYAEGNSTRSSVPSLSKRHTSTASAISEDTAKLVPSAPTCAPSGYGRPACAVIEKSPRLGPKPPPGLTVGRPPLELKEVACQSRRLAISLLDADVGSWTGTTKKLGDRTRPGRLDAASLPGRGPGSGLPPDGAARGPGYAGDSAADGPSIRPSAMLPRWLRLGEPDAPGLTTVAGCLPGRSAWLHLSRPCSLAW